MKKLFVLLFTVIVSVSVWAVPAMRDSIVVRQPNGKTITVFLKGDEHAHMYYTRDGYPLAYDEDGYVRYAQVLSDCSVSVAQMPVANNPENRTAEEKDFLRSFDKLDFSSYYRMKTASRVNKASSQIKKSASKSPSIKIGDFPTTGKIKGLIILAEFKNNEFSFDHEYHHRMMNEENFSDGGATGSARDYFLAQSSEQFQPDFDVVGPVKLQYNMAYYGRNNMMGEDENASLMIEESCKLAQSEFGCDFSNYDNDGDGYVDMVYVIYAGYGEHAGGGANTVWPHKSNLYAYGVDLVLNDKKIDVYACSSELAGNSGTVSSGIGTFCHEFSHVLGLADHYRTDGSSAYILGKYDLMDYGCYNNESRTPVGYSAFERYTVGWLDPEDLSRPADGVEMEAITKSNQAYRLTTSNSDEYFILENRQQEGWDAYIPSSGLMITHIDYDYNDWMNNVVNNDPNHPRVKLVAADNRYDYNTEKEDLYPNSSGNNSFTDESVPSSITWTGEKTDKWITNITNDNGIVSFDFMPNHTKAPVVLPAEEMTDNSFVARWEAVSDAESYTLQLNRLIPAEDAVSALEEDFSLMKSGSVESADAVNIAAELDNYTVNAGWTGENVYQAGGYCKLGSYGLTGWIETPAINLSSKEGVYTVVYTVQSYTGNTPVFAVSANGQKASAKIRDKETTYVCVFTGGTNATSIRFEVTEERAFINDIKVLRGDRSADYPEATVVDVTGGSSVRAKVAAENDADKYAREELMTIKDLKDTSYRFEGLDKDLYSYTVIAHGPKGDSPKSEEVVVDLLHVGIAETNVSTSVMVNGNTVTLSGWNAGETVYVYSMDGCLVKTVVAAAGNVDFELPHAGCYIVKYGANTAKVLIQK